MQGLPNMVGFYPQTKFIFDQVPDCENIIVDLLEAYWDKHVVLFSSGRSALKAYLYYKGYQLHRDSMLVPKYLSKCVLDAITDFAFPKWIPDDTNALLYYHQYGYVQDYHIFNEKRYKYDLIIEDCAHAFFYRSNLNVPAIVSFSKFFDTGCGGALILESQTEKEDIIAWRDSHLPVPLKLEDFIQKVFYANVTQCGQSSEDNNLLAIAYSFILNYVRPLASTLSRFPRTIGELMKIKEKRLETYEFIKGNVKNDKARKFLANVETPPFIVPCCFDDQQLMDKLVKEMSGIGVFAGVYRIEINKNQFIPQYEPAVILPCHQNIPLNTLKQMADILLNY
jgi:hypothetical protein